MNWLSRFFKKEIRFALVGFAVGVVFLCLLSTLAYKTSQTSFCISCHEMKESMKQLEVSKHWKNRSGYMTQCRDCHVSPGLPGIVWAKWRGIGKVKAHFLESPGKGAESWAARRRELKEKLFQEMPQINCVRCHDLDKIKHSGREAEVAHRTVTPGMRCLDCHSVEGLEYLVHNP